MTGYFLFSTSYFLFIFYARLIYENSSVLISILGRWIGSKIALWGSVAKTLLLVPLPRSVVEWLCSYSC